MFELTVFELNVLELNVFELTVFELNVFELTVFELTMFELTMFDLNVPNLYLQRKVEVHSKFCTFQCLIPVKISVTRMHSSRMRTARSLTVSHSTWPGGGVIHACPSCHTCPPVNKMTDKQVSNYYLAATSLRAVNIENMTIRDLIFDNDIEIAAPINFWRVQKSILE